MAWWTDSLAWHGAAALMLLLSGCREGVLFGGPSRQQETTVTLRDDGVATADRSPNPGGEQGVPAADQDPSCPSAPRDPAIWPFETNDPWNMPLGSGAKYARIDSGGFNPNGGAFLNCQRWSHPVFIAQASDPTRTFYQDGQVCATIRVPASATPDPEADAHLHVVDEKHAKVVENWQCYHEGKNFSSGACVVNDLRGPGVYSTWHGVRAYGGSALGGLIRQGELEAGIPHALAVAVQSWALNQHTPNSKGFVWPASSVDKGYQWSYGESGNLHMGSLLAIPPSVKLSSLDLSAVGRQLGRAMQDYGVYITDIGGANMVFYAEPTAAGEITAPVPGDLGKLIGYLQVVTNNTSANRGGGGTRRRCLAPPFIP